MSDNKKRAVIVMVDDAPGACDIMKMYLGSEGYEVYAALSGMEGEALIREKSPDLIFLDIVMPDKSGIEVLSDLRKDGNDTRVVIMTGLGDGPEVAEARKLGISAVLFKPFGLEELSRAMKDHA